MGVGQWKMLLREFQASSGASWVGEAGIDAELLKISFNDEHAVSRPTASYRFLTCLIAGPYYLGHRTAAPASGSRRLETNTIRRQDRFTGILRRQGGDEARCWSLWLGCCFRASRVGRVVLYRKWTSVGSEYGRVSDGWVSSSRLSGSMEYQGLICWFAQERCRWGFQRMAYLLEPSSSAASTANRRFSPSCKSSLFYRIGVVPLRKMAFVVADCLYLVESPDRSAWEAEFRPRALPTMATEEVDAARKEDFQPGSAPCARGA